MKLLTGFVLLALLQLNVTAQRIHSSDVKLILQKEDSMKNHAWNIIRGINPSDRFTADSIFTRIFVRALSIKNSFYYPFDSIFTVSKLYPTDSSFRIFTWQMVINENIIRQHGAIQMRTSDGSLKLFGLIDRSDVTENMEDTIANHNGWMGAVYYKLVQKNDNGNPCYTLIGYDENNIRSNKKIVDVLKFKDGQPVFGGAYFSIPNNNLKPKNPARFILEYKKEASPRLTYDADLDLIIIEHLISESNEPNKKWTLIPDGDYEALKWNNGRWIYINKVFNEVTPEGQAPVPVPLRDAKGNIDYKILKESNTVPKSEKGKK